ncbi:MAG TPA: hypothetical protein VJ984_08325 [Xanthomonadales bacterium]|nr:hypothetical protein [Xanthomonadales bacterium]
MRTFGISFPQGKAAARYKSPEAADAGNKSVENRHHGVSEPDKRTLVSAGIGVMRSLV